MDAHAIKHLGVRLLTGAAFAAGIAALLLLAVSVENSAQFSRWQPWLLLVNILGAIALMVLLVWGVIFGAIVWSHFLSDLPDVRNLLTTPLSRDITLMDDHGRKIGRAHV